VSQAKKTILYVERDEDVLSAQAEIFRGAGYQVEAVLGRAAAESAITKGTFDLVVLGHSLKENDRNHLPYFIKKTRPNGKILTLHASGSHPKVDLAMDSRGGPKAVLDAVASLIAQRVAAGV